VRIFGIDPGSDRTGYGCVDSDGTRHRLVACGAIATRSCETFPDKLRLIHHDLAALIAAHRPAVVAVENVFYAANVRSALKLGHARGVAILAAVQQDVPVTEYTPAQVKRAIVGYGRAEKHQVQEMVRVLLGLREVPEPNDAADALAVAICHIHMSAPGLREPAPAGGGTTRRAPAGAGRRALTSWRNYRPPGDAR
jgi:crossover junction endodeoxyribonuclease RuvC